MSKLVLAVLLAALYLSAAENRIPGRIDQSRTVPVAGHAAPGARARIDRGPVGSSLRMDSVTLLLRPDPSLDGFLTDLQNPGSPDYHHWLTPEQFADRFGLTQSDIAKVTAWITSQGLRVTQVARGRHWVTVSGTAEQIGRAFHTEIHNFSDGQEVHYANATDPSVPEALAGVVAGFIGLDDFGPKPQMVKPLYNRSGSHYLAPDDFATLFDLKPLYNQGVDGTGQSIMVIGQTAVDLADIRSFRMQFGLPDNDPQLVLTGQDPGKRSGDMEEADLDIEWSGAVAPKAKIIYVYSTSVLTSLLYGVDQNLAPVMTLSYGGCEQNYTPAWRYVAQQANAQGITWMVSSGDQGAASCDFTAATPQASKGATVTWPSGIPEVIAVGGTGLNDAGGTYWSSSNNANLGSALSYIPETAWNDSVAFNDLAATGGGFSVWYSKPSWQKGPGVPADGARDVPDVSFPASPLHGAYAFTSGGKAGAAGGTSASSPAFAGVVALLNQYLTSTNVLSQPGLGNLNPMLYRLAQASPEAFHDISTGDNRVPCVQSSPDCRDGLVGYPAAAGYDLATGLGSIDVGILAQRWNTGLVTTTTVSVDNQTPGLDDAVTLVATVRGPGSAKPTGTVTFTTNDTVLGTANITADGTATVHTTAVQIAATTGVVSAAYGGDSVFDASNGSLKVSVVMPTAGSVVVPVISPNPVFQQTSTTGPAWYFTITLKEMAGVATKLTGLSVDGQSYDSQIVNFFKTANIPAHGSISAPVVATEITTPFNSVNQFSGVDANGQTWTRSATVRLVGPPGPYLIPGITLTSSPQTVQQNPQADPSCQWVHQLGVQEQSGFTVQLTKLLINGTDSTGQIQSIFGTTRLAPFGSLEGTICWDSTQSSGPKVYQMTGATETGGTVTTTVTANLSASATAPAVFSASRDAVVWQLANSTQSGASAVDLKFSTGSPHWSASVLPGNRTSSWLSVSPVSGSGSGSVSLQASTAGLSAGVYRALVAVQVADAVPQLIEIPVTLTIGAPGNVSIAGGGNGASFDTVFAPGMLASVFGTALSSATQSAPFLPLPLSLQGVSATVNGISAPLYFVSPGQINLQIPYEAGSGPAVLAINNNGNIASMPLRIAAVAPGIFTDSAHGLVPSGNADPGQVTSMYITGEGDVTPTLPTGATPPSSTPISRFPKPRLPLAVTVGGVPAEVRFWGIPTGLAGVTQVNFVVPLDAPSGAQPVVVTVGGVASKPATLNVGGK